MASTTTIICACGCKRTKEVKNADIKRGWGKYFSKSCKAKHQEKRTGQYSAYKQRRDHNDFSDHVDDYSAGYNGQGWG